MPQLLNAYLSTAVDVYCKEQFLKTFSEAYQGSNAKYI